MKRKAELEEDRLNRQLQLDREERERQKQIEQARVDRLLNEASLLRQAMDIRAYVDAVKNIVANETSAISSDAIERWLKSALAEADRIDPVRSARFLDTFETEDDPN